MLPSKCHVKVFDVFLVRLVRIYKIRLYIKEKTPNQNHNQILTKESWLGDSKTTYYILFVFVRFVQILIINPYL